MMAATRFTVESAVLGWLKSTGWRVAHGPDIAPDIPAAKRTDYGEVVSEQLLRNAGAQSAQVDLPRPIRCRTVGTVQYRKAREGRILRDW
jgi:hypothetical protein